MDSMAHYITTSASYILNKYSRSYPSPALPNGQTSTEPEWQHFTNPIMRIVLDAKKSPSGELVSMRLRIAWSLHMESSDAPTDQREVIFEDLELLSFSSSSSSTFQLPGPQFDHSLPLKAVYRDAVVGIRYLHPTRVPPGFQPSYRRFQITFKDALNASQFIDAIKPVCPCKANPPPSQIPRHPTTLTPSLTRAATTVPGAVQAAQIARQTQPLTSVATPPTIAMLAPLASERVQFNQTTLGSSTSTTPSLSSDDSPFVTCSETSRKTDNQLSNQKETARGSYSRPVAINSSLPSSSQPSSSDQSVAMPPPRLPQNATHISDTRTVEPSRRVNTTVDKSPLLASLSQGPALHELSQSDLETLVGLVIREEGFLQLLDSLDSLWKVKGFLGR